MTDAERRKEFVARWVNFQQRMSDVYANHPSDDELILQLREACALKNVLGEYAKEVWDFLAERGCLTPKSLRWIEDNVPEFARMAGRMLQELESQPAQTAMELAEP